VENIKDEKTYSTKSWSTALILSVIFGGVGFDRFYLGYGFLGFLKFITLGGLGFWYIIDLVLIGANKIKDNNGLELKK
jgi:TM2 domain-containing membrane protein YozV